MRIHPHPAAFGMVKGSLFFSCRIGNRRESMIDCTGTRCNLTGTKASLIARVMGHLVGNLEPELVCVEKNQPVQQMRASL